MNIRLIALTALMCFSQMALAQPKEKIQITGFARLLEEEIFLPNAIISLDVFDWDGNTANQPQKKFTKLLRTGSDGRFKTFVPKGRWFRLSLRPGQPPNINQALAVWMQHAIPEWIQPAMPKVGWLSDEALRILLYLNSHSTQFFHYIAIDSGLMLADHDYTGRNREISFQVPLEITSRIITKLARSIYGQQQEASSCQLVVTALSPRGKDLTCQKKVPFLPEKKDFDSACPSKDYQPEVQNLFDCPHGASGVTFTSVPESKVVHYFGINDKCKTDVLVSGLNATTRDGGAFLGNITPNEGSNIGLVRGIQGGTELPEDYFLCEPGHIINISPPHGPAGLNPENGYQASGIMEFSALVGIGLFAADLVFSMFSMGDNAVDDDKKQKGFYLPVSSYTD